VELRLGLILPNQFRSWPKIDDPIQLPFAELLLQLVPDSTQPLIFDGGRSQFMLIVHEIKIEDRNRLEFCATRLRMKDPQHSAQYGVETPRRGVSGTMELSPIATDQ
jgi:hypothetical protein